MAQMIQLPLAGSGSIPFEVDDASSGWPCRGAGDGPIAMASETFEAVIGRLKPVAEAQATELSDHAPALVSVAGEFGVKLNTNTGVVIAKFGCDASLRSTVGLNPRRRTHPKLP